MTRHPFDTMTTAALRDLDPAPAGVLTEAERERADATYARILATPAPDHSPEKSDRRWRRTRVLVPVGLAGAVAVPALWLGGGSAFASWTPEPERLTPEAATEAGATCRAALEVPDRGERVLVAEQRGGWIYVLLVGAAAEGFCLMPDDLVGHQDPAQEQEDGFFGGYDPDAAAAPTPARNRIVETGSIEGSVPTPGIWPFISDRGWFHSVQGHVGSDVTEVTVHTPGGVDVQASVAHGRFAAWWPSEQPGSEHPDAMGAWTYTVTLDDGSQTTLSGNN